MVDQFPAWLAFVLRRDFDGQPLHVTPDDPGGATAFGITLATAESMCRELGQPFGGLPEMRTWTAETPTVGVIYGAGFWDANHCDDLPAGLDGMVFDHGCGAGPERAAKLLQAAVAAGQDGNIGPATLAAVRRWPPADLVRRYHDLRARYYASLPEFHEFGRGWDRRDDAARDLGLQKALFAAA